MEVQSARDAWSIHPDQIGTDLPPSRAMLAELVGLSLIERDEEAERWKAFSKH